ncbi:hypothetical protein [Rhodopila sp.]|uniref:hypothetical protein n=1 Tax=Rhodopila sp. TaxID=2480087 RepID=UPI003D1193E4
MPHPDGDPNLILIDKTTEGLAPLLVEQRRAAGGNRQPGHGDPAGRAETDDRAEDLPPAVCEGHGQIVFEGTPDDLALNGTIRREWLEV